MKKKIPPSVYQDAINEQIKKCYMDPLFFIKEYVKIQHQKRGIINFKTYPFQEKTLQSFHQNDRNIVLKSRQMGISTLVSAYSLWLMIFYPGKNVLIISTKQDASKEIISKVRLANDNLPSWLKIPMEEDNRLSIKFKNQSRILAVSSAVDSARGFSAGLLIMDECAFIENAAEIWTSAQQTLAASGGKAILLSSPDGQGNFFHKTWMDAEAGINNFTTIRLKWDLHPEHDQAWRDKQTAELGIKKAGQECFSGDVIVYTKYGPKQISSINIGDQVLTHTGNYEKVTNVMTSVSDVLECHTSNNYIKKHVTENHPFLTQNGWKAVNKISKNDNIIQFPINSLISNNIEIIDIYNNIHPKYFKKILCDFDKKFYINDRKQKIVHNRYINLNYDFGFLLGLYLAEGSGCRLRKVFNFNYLTELESWPNKLKIIVKDQFGFSNSQIRCTNNEGHLSFCSEIFSSTIDLFIDGKDCYNKKLSSFFYKHLNKSLISGVIDGVFRGDGCLKTAHYKTFSTTSIKLLYDISYLLNLISISDISIRKIRTEGKISIFKNKKYLCNNSWGIKIKKTVNLKVNELTDVIPVSKKNIAKIHTNNKNHLKVFNLSVENDNSYITEYGIVHNCDTDFISSGNTVIDSDILSFYEKTHICDPVEKRGRDGGLWIWEYPDYNKKYIVSADSARGDGSDSSAFHVIDIVSLTQVAEYKGLVDTKTYGRELVNIASYYNNAILIVENNNMGWAVLQEILDLKYPNTFYSSSDLTYVDIEKKMSYGVSGQDQKLVPGFTTTSKTRPLIISKLELYFRENTVIIKSKRTMDELQVFIWNNSKAEAMKGYNDDLCLSLGIGLWVRDTALRLFGESAEIKMAMLNSIKKVGNVRDEKNPILNSQHHKDKVRDAWRYKDAYGNQQNLSWLL